MGEAIRRATPRWVLVCSIGLAWAAAVATALLLALIGGGVDALASGGRASGARLIAAAVLAVIAGLATGAGEWLSASASSQTERRLRQAVIARVFQLGPTRTRGRTGELLSMATNSVERTAGYRAAFLGPIAGALTTPLLVLAVMALTTDPGIAWRLALLILLVPLAIGGFQRLVRPIGAAYRRSQARLTSGFLEAVQALDTLVYARAADRTAVRLAERGEQHRRSLMRMLAGNQLLILVVDAAFSLTVVVAGGVLAAMRVASGQLSVGQGIAVLLMTVLVIGPVDVVGQFFYIGIAGRAHQRILGRHLGSGKIAARRSGTGVSQTGVSHTGDALVLEGVTASWAADRPVLSGLSLRVGRGEQVALVGPSGIGKSTVSALIQGHLMPASGRVLVDGMDTRSTDPALLRSRLAVVEQRPFLFLGSIADNLRMAAPDATEADLWRALEVAGLDGDVRAMPQGLETPVGERGRTLSGGQAQRLAIARAVLRDAPILILDEPTSEVDLAAEAGILEALGRLARGRTVLLIAHRPGAILAADRVVDLGALLEETR
ncbi:MAG: ABC transporter ATP-binding protein/permease [Acidipropionibacterium sp.]|nr:ABC transporter ATP-binding protein/permease [Acidipropionibacterium sp.]